MRKIDLTSYGIVVVLFLLVLIFSVTADRFLSFGNLVNVLDQAAVLGTAAVGETMCIVSQTFDLSLGGIFAVAAIVAVMMANISGSTLVGCVCGVLAGMLLGLVNGVVVNVLRIHSFIATLATGLLFTGFAILLTGGQIVSVISGAADTFGLMNLATPIGGITVASWTFLIAAVLCGVVLSFTVYGRALYALGGNREAARMSGIHTTIVAITVMMISGAGAGLAGVIEASRTGTAQAHMLPLLALSAIAATVVGGTSILGGRGAIWRTVIGVLVITVISNGFNLTGVDATYLSIIKGTLIIAAVTVDRYFRGEN